MDWITATDLDRWADERLAEGMLPQLMRRLIVALTEKRAAMDMPSGDSVNTGGWDGILNLDQGTEHLPAGSSCWEFGTNKNKKGKADEDYAKRTASPEVLNPAETTYVGVTPRKWPLGKKTWIQARKAEGLWRDVRFLDADDLEAMLEQAPSVAIWLAERMGKITGAFESLDEYWAGWVSGGSLPPALVLADRQDVAADFLQWVQGPPARRMIRAHTPDEAIAFVAAALSQPQDQAAEAAHARTIVVKDQAAFQAAARWKSPLIIVLEGLGIENALVAVHAGHHVVIPCGYTTRRHDDLVSLVRPTRHAFASALKAAGYGDAEADALAVQTGCTLSAFRRRLGGYRHPEWATPEHLKALVPAFLAGSWVADAKDEKKRGDREFLAALAGKPYEIYELDLVGLTTVPDAPLVRVKSYWRITAPVDAFHLVAPYITDALLETLREKAFQLLAQRDPQLDLPLEERYAAAVWGKTLDHSGALRNGILGTLALLAHYGDQETQLQASTHPSSFAYGLVRDLLKNANGERWMSLQGNLDDLAEVSPKAFLEAIEASLAQERPPIMELFQEGDSTFSGCSHASLLWGLEALAWDPSWLPRVCHALAALASRDPGGRWANRPAPSLLRILLPWLPATFASVDERLEALDAVVDAFPSVGWPLLLDLGPAHHGSAMGARHPHWLPVHGTDQRPKTYTELWEVEGRVIERIRAQLGSDAERWKDIFNNRLSAYPQDIQAAWINELKGLTDKQHLTGDLAGLRDAVRHYRYVLCLGDDGKEKDTAVLEELEATLAPRDLIKKHQWLFESAWVDIPGARRTESEEAKARRQDAVDEIVGHLGVEAIFELIEVSGDSSQVAFVMVHRPFGDTFHEALLKYAEEAEPTMALRQFLAMYVSLRHRAAGWAWTDALLALAATRGWPPESHLALLFGLPGGKETWRRVDAIGGPIAAEYWKRVNLWVSRDEEPGACEELFTRALDAGRPLDVVDAMGMVVDRMSLPTPLIVRALRELAANGQAGRQIDGNIQYDIVQIFEALEGRNDMAEQDLALLEIPYVKVFRLSKRPTLTLHRILSKSPDDFALFIKWLYKRKDGKEDEDAAAPEQLAANAALAWEVLSSWRQVPGASPDGDINEESLSAWVAEAREKCLSLGRLKAADSAIGEMLAYAPAAKDDVWPCLAVRNAIQAAKSEALENGLRVGLFNKRGITSRDPYDGGAQERELAARYKSWADAQRVSWPRIAAVLDDMAEDYAFRAKQEDDDAQRLRLRD